MSLRSPPVAIHAVVLAWALHLAWMAPRLPERVATHFGASGEPNGWMSRTGFVLFEVCFFAILVAIVGGLAVSMRRLPASAFSLPHRDHWLAPEREAATRAAIQGQVLWFLCGTILFLVGLNQLTLAANLAPEPHLPGTGFAVLVAAYLGGLVAWSVRFVARFRLPRER